MYKYATMSQYSSLLSHLFRRTAIVVKFLLKKIVFKVSIHIYIHLANNISYLHEALIIDYDIYKQASISFVKTGKHNMNMNIARVMLLPYAYTF
jgi:hypothetical protein